MSQSFRLLMVAVALFGSTFAEAASLSVVPISVDVVRPATIGTVTLRNRESRPLPAQVRVFRWTQVDGEDRLEPTDDVVASPQLAHERRGDGGHAARGRARRLGAFKQRHPLFEHRDRRIGET